MNEMITAAGAVVTFPYLLGFDEHGGVWGACCMPQLADAVTGHLGEPRLQGADPLLHLDEGAGPVHSPAHADQRHQVSLLDSPGIHVGGTGVDKVRRAEVTGVQAGLEVGRRQRQPELGGHRLEAALVVMQEDQPAHVAHVGADLGAGPLGDLQNALAIWSTNRLNDSSS